MISENKLRTTTPVDHNIVKIYGLLQSVVRNTKINQETIMSIVPDAMRIAETLIRQKAKGAYKKELVMSAIIMIIKNAEELHAKTRLDLENLVKAMVPPAIDIFVAIAKGKLDIGKRAKTCFLSLGNCFSA